MNDKRAMDLYELLPALYRIRDAERGYPLRALLEIISEQVDLVKQDIDGLWDDLFIETCADWVVPYIGDLVGNSPLHAVVGRWRADVAKTIYYRRRKGTLPMLEELARDVTGWGVHAVQFFELLGWTQNLNHLRNEKAPNSCRRDPEAVDRVGTANLRNLDALDCLDGPFDLVSHTVDVRPIGGDGGWHHLRHIGFFVWRLNGYPLQVAPRQSSGHAYGYHFSPLGSPAALFTYPRREADEAGLATEIHVPGPIRPLALHLDLERVRRAVAKGEQAQSAYVGPQSSLSIQVVAKDGAERLIPPEAIVCMNLKDWRQPENLTYREKQPGGAVVDQPIQLGIDAARGRFVFAKGQEPKKNGRVQVLYHYGFSTDIGGGSYDRHDSLADRGQPAKASIVVAKRTSTDTIQDALKEWADQGKPPCIIQIADSGVYGGDIDIQMPDKGWLTIEASSGMRPSVRLVGNTSMVASGKDATLTLNGLLVEGSLELSDDLNLSIRHCTLVPGRMLKEDGSPAFPDRDSVVVKGPAPSGLTVTIDKSIVGSLRLPAEARHLTITDSVVHALEAGGTLRPAIAGDDTGTLPGPPTTLERVTVWGSVHAKELRASEVIFTSPVRAQRRQEGCIRFSYVPGEGSQTPRRYHCQPDLALQSVTCPQAQARICAQLVPMFTSVHYGDPGYAQLSLACAKEIRTGAEDGSEMGVFCSLKQPHREANLRIRLEEYLPFGLEAGIIYATSPIRRWLNEG